MMLRKNVEVLGQQTSGMYAGKYVAERPLAGRDLQGQENSCHIGVFFIDGILPLYAQCGYIVYDDQSGATPKERQQVLRLDLTLKASLREARARPAWVLTMHE